jgi:hypothetical protein
LSRHNAVDTASTHTIYRNLAHEQIILFGVLRPDGSCQRVVFGFSVRRMNVPTPRALATIAFRTGFASAVAAAVELSRRSRSTLGLICLVLVMTYRLAATPVPVKAKKRATHRGTG